MITALSFTGVRPRDLAKRIDWSTSARAEETQGGGPKSEAEDDKLPLTDLRAACLKWLESMWIAPRAAASHAHVADEDR